MEPPRKFRWYRFFSRIIMMFIVWFITWLFSTIQFTKTEIAKMYGVSIQTLNKWVVSFCPNIHPDTWKRKKLLNLEWVNKIFNSLGMPNKHLTLSKGEIAEKCETNTNTLKENVERLFNKIGINLMVYKKVNVFPPAYTKVILNKMG